ncbi:hypothetical protein HEP87_63575 [Streptomyces sp. S1D4-11]
MTERDSATSKAFPSTVASSPATGGLVLVLAEADEVAAADAFQQDEYGGGGALLDRLGKPTKCS